VCIGAALDVREAVAAGAVDLPDAGLRIVVEAVAGEEDGGYGAATAALANPYPFDRDAAIVAEPTELRPVVACEGSLMARLELVGRSAHAATRWRGEDVLPRFEAIREAFAELETERGETVDHPLYREFPVPWPVVCGTVEAGSWASTVPATLTAEFRIGVAPGETVDEVEETFRARLDDVVADDPWLREHPPTFERFSVQFEPAEIAVDEPIVEAARAGIVEAGLPDAEPTGATYGADSRHYIAAGIPTVLLGPEASRRRTIRTRRSRGTRSSAGAKRSRLRSAGSRRATPRQTRSSRRAPRRRGRRGRRSGSRRGV